MINVTKIKRNRFIITGLHRSSVDELDRWLRKECKNVKFCLFIEEE